MANFKVFEPILLQQEGGYANKSADSGGETWEGISRNNYPKWAGWALVDAAKKIDDFPFILHKDQALQTMVDTFYKCQEWDTLQADKIQNQSIANFIVDWGVNAGDSVPVEHVQEILCLSKDGKMGPLTLAGINDAFQNTLFVGLQQARIKFYNDVVAAHPEDKQFLSNWLSRAKSFSFS